MMRSNLYDRFTIMAVRLLLSEMKAQHKRDSLSLGFGLFLRCPVRLQQ